VNRAYAAVVSLALIGATLWPVVRDPREDGFPLSTYPMFAWKRATQQTYRYALGETATGQRRTLSPHVVGTAEVLQAMRVLERSIGSGRGQALKLCEQIAARVALDAEFADLVAIRMVSGTHDAIDYLVRGIVGREVELVRCAVPR
jgi:hypothetical protein